MGVLTQVKPPWAAETKGSVSAGGSDHRPWLPRRTNRVTHLPLLKWVTHMAKLSDSALSSWLGYSRSENNPFTKVLNLPSSCICWSCQKELILDTEWFVRETVHGRTWALLPFAWNYLLVYHYFRSPGSLVVQEHPSGAISTLSHCSVLRRRPSASAYASVEQDLSTALLPPGEEYLVWSNYCLPVSKTCLRSQEKQLFIATTNPN